MSREPLSISRSSLTLKKRRSRKAAKEAQRRLMAPLDRSKELKPLDIETLHPLIDISYYSDFAEVRRDAAAAFVALSISEQNLEVMSKAGCLGALLCLMGIDGKISDPDCRRDAAVALEQLCKLDDIKARLLSAPNGFEGVLRMTGEEHGRVKKAAIQIIERLCSLKSTCMTVVESKGLCSLVQQLACKDISIRLRTARVLQSVAQHDLPDGYFGDEEIMKHVQLALREDFVESDEPIEYALLTYAFRASQGEDHCTAFVRGGLVDICLIKLGNQIMNLQHVLLIMQIFLNLAKNEENHQVFLHDEGFLSIATKTVFRDLPLRREQTLATRSFYLSKSKPSPKSQCSSRRIGVKTSRILIGDGGDLKEAQRQMESGALTVELDILRKLAQIILILTSIPENIPTVIESKVMSFFNVSLLTEGEFAADRKLSKAVALMLWNLLSASEHSKDLCHKLGAQGALDLAQYFLFDHDDTRKGYAVRALAIFFLHTNLHSLISDENIFREIISMGYISSEQPYVCQLISRMCEMHNLRHLVKECGAIEVCIHILKSYEPIRFNPDILAPLMIIFEKMVRYDGVDELIIKSDALSQFLKISKLKSPPAEGAGQVLRVMKEQVSALQIQLIMSSFVSKMRARKRRAAAVEKARKEKEERADTERQVAALAAMAEDAERRLGRV